MSDTTIKSHCEIITADKAQLSVLEAMLATHLAELGAPAVYPYLSCYWQESGRFPFFILVDSKIIGFALVRQTSSDKTYELAEFYIQAQSRRMGFGAAAVRRLLSSLDGTWHLSVSLTLLACTFGERL